MIPRHPVGAHVLHGKIQCPLKVLVDCALVPVGEGDHLVQERRVPRLRDVFIDRGKQPQGVVRPVGRMAGLLDIGGILRRILVAGIVGELHQGQTAAVMDLGGEHKAEFFRRLLRG